MKRWKRHPISSAAFIATLFVAATFPTDADAYCPWGTEEPGWWEEALLFVVEDDYSDWNAVFGGGLSTSTSNSQYYRDVLLHWVDSASQQWSRDARPRWKVGYRDLDPDITSSAYDTLSSVTVNNSTTCPGVAWTALNTSDWTCDIMFSTECIGSIAQQDGFTFSSGEDATLERVLRHEMGHCLGLAHPSENWTGGCDVSDCDDTTVGGPGEVACTPDHPLMCQNDCEKHWDSPHPDDIYGVQHIVHSAHPLVFAEREANLRLGYYNTSNTWVFSRDLDLGIDAIWLPRLDCKSGAGVAGSADCVLATSQSAGNISLVRLKFPGADPTSVATGTTTATGVRPRRSADVALNADASRAVVAVAGATDDVGTAWSSVRVLTFSNTSNSLLATTTLSATSFNTQTGIEPRVVFVRGINRFVVAYLEPSRRIRFFVSPTASGTGTYSALSIGGTQIDAIDDSFEIACPKHVASGSGDNTCRVVYTPAETWAARGRANNCTITFSTTSATWNSCSGTFRDTPTVHTTGLSDYGLNTPSGQRSSYSWILAVSEDQPHVLGVSGMLELYSNSNGALFSPTYRVEANQTNTDFAVSCDPIEPPEYPQFLPQDIDVTYFGGASLDYCEKCQRVLRTGLGDVTGPSAGWESQCH